MKQTKKQTKTKEERCKCGAKIPRGYGYYNHNLAVRCFLCGRINKKPQNDKVSEEVRELVYSDYNNKYEQLKSELKEIEKGCKKRITYQDISTKCGEEIGDIGITFKVYCPTCQAKIEYLKKGISACEEILNSQQTKPLEFVETDRGCKPISLTGITRCNSSKDKTADTQTLIKQALSQRNQEILEMIEKFQKELLEIIDDCVSDWSYIEKKYNEKFDELKQQLNQPKEEDLK